MTNDEKLIVVELMKIQSKVNALGFERLALRKAGESVTAVDAEMDALCKTGASLASNLSEQALDEYTNIDMKGMWS